MNKLELISALQHEAAISKPEATRVVRQFFEAIVDAMVDEGRAEIRGLFSFYVKKYESYTGRNPKTGKQVTVQAKKLPFFKCGRELKARVDPENNR